MNEKLQPEKDFENLSAEEKEERFRAFLEEIRRFREEEKQSGRTGHLQFEGFNVEDLTEEDMRIWNLLQSRNFTRQNILDYQRSIKKSGNILGETLPGIPESRAIFMGLVGNLASGLLLERELDELERKEREGQ